MTRKKPDVVFNFKVFIGVAAVILFMLGLVLLAQGFIDTNRLHDQIQQSLKEKTGRDVTIRGQVSVSLLPLPAIYVPGVELRDSSNSADSSTPTLTIEMLRLGASLGTIFSNHPQINSITLEQPVLEVERAHSGMVTWDWLNFSLLKPVVKTGGESAIAPSFSVGVKDGRIVYRDDLNDRVSVVQNINLSGSVDEQIHIGGSVNLYDHTVHFSLKREAGSNADKSVTLRLYTNDKNSLSWQGTANFDDPKPVLKGALALELEDAAAWVHAPTSEPRGNLERITNEAMPKAADISAFPVKLSANWQEEGAHVTLSDLHWQGLNSAGDGSLDMDYQQIPSLDVKMVFSVLDYNDWEMIFNRITGAQDKTDATAAKLYNAPDDSGENPLPKNLRLHLNIAAAQVLIGPQTWKNEQINATLEDAALTVDQFNIELPGDTSLSMFGIISQGSSKGMRFEGSMETRGKSLRQLLTVFDESASELPDAGFGAFYARANIFVSPEQVRLSEADVKISELHLNGGLVAYHDSTSTPRLEADVRLKDINFDYFRDVWRKKQIDSGQQDFFLKLDKTLSFNWLKKLQSTIDFKVNVDHFTFLERRGNTASFRIFAKEGEFGIYDMHMIYPQDTLEASFNINVTGEQPLVNLVLNTSELNTNYFSLGTPAPTPALSPAAEAEPLQKVQIVPQSEIFMAQVAPENAPAAPAQALSVQELPDAKTSAKPAPPDMPAPDPKSWPQDLIDMSWMEGINAAIDISIGKLTHHDTVIDSLKMRAKLENNLLTFQTLSFIYWEGKCDVSGSLYGGTVPGLALGFTLYDAELHTLLKSLVDRDNISGRVSLSGTLATSGVNYLSWISQLDAKIVMAARGVNVQGVNLQGVVDAVGVSRTASDVFNNVNLTFGNGSTEFNVDGNLNVHAGVIRTPGITLKSGTITGNLTGEARLVPWSMELSTQFQFPAMTSETIPTMTVQMAGAIDKPNLQIDTASLEAYVAKRIVGR